MSEKTINIINSILYYVIAPVLVLEFFLSDLGLLPFTKVIFIGSIAVLFVFIAMTYVYKRQHPDYEFKANELYTKIIFLLILFECFYYVGIFK